MYLVVFWGNLKNLKSKKHIAHLLSFRLTSLYDNIKWKVSNGLRYIRNRFQFASIRFVYDSNKEWMQIFGSQQIYFQKETISNNLEAEIEGEEFICIYCLSFTIYEYKIKHNLRSIWSNNRFYSKVVPNVTTWWAKYLNFSISMKRQRFLWNPCFRYIFSLLASFKYGIQR